MLLGPAQHQKNHVRLRVAPRRQGGRWRAGRPLPMGGTRERSLPRVLPVTIRVTATSGLVPRGALRQLPGAPQALNATAAPFGITLDAFLKPSNSLASLRGSQRQSGPRARSFQLKTKAAPLRILWASRSPEHAGEHAPIRVQAGAGAQHLIAVAKGPGANPCVPHFPVASDCGKLKCGARPRLGLDKHGC